MFLGVSETVCLVDIQQELTEIGREVVAGRLLVEQRVRFKGSKKAAYTAAGVNPATWDRAITQQRVRPDKLVQIVTALWPESGGDWQAIPRIAQVQKPAFQADLDALSRLSEWIRRAARDGHEVPPPTEALILWDFDQLLEGLAMKHDEEVALREMNAQIAAHDAEALRQEMTDGGDGNVDADDDAGDSPSTKLAARERYARAAREGKPVLKTRREEHDRATEAVPEDPTGMEPI